MSLLATIAVQIAHEPGQSEVCDIDLVQSRPVELRIQSRHLGSMAFTGDDVFEALVALRLRLEQDGYLLLCNAARKDAYPSRMSREMGGGRKIYLLKQGMQAHREDLVDVFAAATYDQVATVAEQRSTYEAWIRSLK